MDFSAYQGPLATPVVPPASPAAPRSVPILIPNEQGQYTLDEAALRSVLMQDNVRHLPVVVISVAGAFRRGKSFLLSLLLRYLDAGGVANWLGREDQPLDTGFAWRGGRHRHTVGIHMWSRPALVRLPSGTSVAVVLMDTQGAFDDRTSVSENAAVFAMSALTSSVQIYNVANNIGTNDMQHLQQFAAFGRTAVEDDAAGGDGRVPFQKLLFLVRDWQSPSEAGYGEVGGRTILAEALGYLGNANEELRKMRADVRRAFSDVDCFLMPHPGKKVATSSTFNGCPRDIDPEFLTSLDQLAKLVLSPERLIIKKSVGGIMTAEDLVTHFQVYCRIFQSGTLPKPRSLVDTMAEANNLSGVSSGTNLYAEQMREICSEDSTGVTEDELEEHHQVAVSNSTKHFDEQKKMHGVSNAAEYKQKLMDNIKHWHGQFFQANKLKNQLAEARDGLRCSAESGKARDLYKQQMGQIMRSSEEAVENAQLAEDNRREQSRVLMMFDTSTSGCRPDIRAEYRNNLERLLEETWQEVVMFNDQSRQPGGAVEAEQDRDALESARTRYRNIMRECMNGGPMSEQDLDSHHQNAERDARNVLMAGRGLRGASGGRVEEFFDRSLGENLRVNRQENTWTTIINAVVPLLTPLIAAATRRCVIM